ncbi:RING finger and transmembrane domain-containing protein 1-like [Pyrus ussuriensis x Pyrus communis]|uniref:RING finger and transmembrane domain-containing protein 1-like n=1 Tax=Pyrus ussuriensis x Pyrus communis TaxID=2448454 RepID=A0A5N5FSF8_9ROSA|nr:RING finger and transmembrane domain-containing protein 1-like [Pyrus ussuriensis x Pyrus communis]
MDSSSSSSPRTEQPLQMESFVVIFLFLQMAERNKVTLGLVNIGQAAREWGATARERDAGVVTNSQPHSPSLHIRLDQHRGGSISNYHHLRTRGPQEPGCDGAVSMGGEWWVAG